MINKITILPRSMSFITTFLLFVVMLLVVVVPHLCFSPVYAFSTTTNNNNNNNKYNNNPSLEQIGTTKNVATQVLQGVGPISADHLNKYNLDNLEQIASEWTANLVQKVNENNAKLKLGCLNNKELYVDTVKVSFPRLPDTGLGIELQEIAGGRDDGLGITIITNILPDGAAAAAAEVNNILPGDSISEISIIRNPKQRNGLEEKQEVITVQTECLGYDATVNAIINDIPSADNEKFNDTYEITLKRIRRKPKVTVNLQYPPSQNEQDISIQLFAGENLRQGMLIRGVKLNDPLAKRFDTKNSGNCGAGGLCRTCSVIITRDTDNLLNPQRIAEKTMLKNNPRWRLACKAIVGYGMKEGEITIKVNPNQW